MSAGTSPIPGCVRVAVSLLLVAGGLAGDDGARVLTWPAAGLLLAAGLRDLVLRPVLQADASGLDVVHGLRRLRVAWVQVEDLRVVRDRRTPLLEIDLGEQLVVLQRSRLGRAPEQVLEELSALQSRGA